MAMSQRTPSACCAIVSSTPTIASRGCRREHANHRVACLRIEVIELRDVPPRCEKWIATARDEVDGVRRIDRMEVVGGAAVVVERSLDVELRTRPDPLVIEAGVIRHEIDEQRDLTARQR